MDTVKHIREQAKQHKKTIVLPEYDDKRIIEAARIIEEEGIAETVVLSPDRVSPQEKERFIAEYTELHRVKHHDPAEVRRMFEDPLYPAAMMTRAGVFDGLVAGAGHTTPDMARAAIRCLEIDERISIVSSSFIMDVPRCRYGEEGTFVFADCGIIPDPNARQLSCIALSAAEFASKVLKLTPRIAFLSYSTKGSAKTKSANKITEALDNLQAMSPGILADGELQVDAAIVPEVAEIKFPDSPVGGRANVLIFPDLEAGNIGYKLVERLAGARAIGPVMLGLNRPASDLSRGCSIDDIVDCTAVTAICAQ
ncbi:MAG: phosphotransacetylase [Candidatus Omnitrophica bacterium]|nr:phosphotransacetylase [Candidatus Omnitrophota bacterium]